MKNFLNQTTNFGLVLFILLSIYNIYKDFSSDMRYMRNIELTQKQMNHIDINSQIILELQNERGLTNIYFAKTSTQHLKTLLKQRKNTSITLINASQKLQHSVNDIRISIDQGSANKLQVFYNYSNIIRSLLQDTESLTFNTTNKTLKNELMIYNDLNYLQEVLGQIRSTIGVVLSSKILSDEDKQEIKRLNTIFYHNLEETFRNDLITSRTYTRNISKTKCLKKTLLISQSLEKEFNTSNLQLSALEWFDLSTCAINKINSFLIKQRNIVNNYLIYEVKKAKDERLTNGIFWLLGAVVLSIFVFISFRRSKELLKEQALLKSYQVAIDYASIVSKTDTNGVITYVNNNFSTLFGYSNKELIGQKHNVIKHPDMADHIFSDMWATIAQGKKWHGLIKNKAKDGSTYWADSSIIPILDDNGDILEYISIRHDVSDIINLQEEIEDTQRELVYRLGEAVESRSKESGNHIKRVAHYSKLLAELSNLSHTECEMIFAASSMHDVGKIAIPDSILLKPGRLDDEEWNVMKMHSEIGYNLFRHSNRPLLKAAANIAHEHHEHYNGNGYPRSLKSKEISTFGRIVAIADVFDALSTERVYKKAWPMEDVILHLKEGSGEQFDPQLIKLFLDNLNQFMEIRNKFE